MAVFRDFISESKPEFNLKPEANVLGRHGQGPVDYAIIAHPSGEIVVVTEVKREDFEQGIAQNAVQIESALRNGSANRKKWNKA
jgi:hypothetical protein